LTIRAGIASDKRHAHSSWASDGGEVHRALPLVLSRGLSRHTTASTPSGACPGLPAAWLRAAALRSLGKYSLSETDVLRSVNDANGATRDGPAAEAERLLFLGKGDLRRRSSRDGLAPKAVTRPCQRERLNSTQVGASQPIEGSRKRTPEASAAC